MPPEHGLRAPGPAMGDLMQRGKDYLSQNAGGIGGGALAGGLAGYMMGSKKGAKMAKKAATYGGLALVAGLAYKAYSDYQGKKAGVPVVDGQVGRGDQTIPAHLHAPQGATSRKITHVPVVPMGSGFEVNEMTQRATGFGATLVSAMIAAAKADGTIDAQEQQAIFGKIAEEDLSAEEKAFLLDQINSRSTLIALSLRHAIPSRPWKSIWPLSWPLNRTLLPSRPTCLCWLRGLGWSRS